MTRLIREQAEYMAGHETRFQEAEKRNRDVDVRIEPLVSAVGAILTQHP